MNMIIGQICYQNINILLGGNTVPFCESSHQSFSFKTSQIEISLPDTFTRNLNKLSIKIYMFDLLYVGCLFVCLSSCLKPYL